MTLVTVLGPKWHPSSWSIDSTAKAFTDPLHLFPSLTDTDLIYIWSLCRHRSFSCGAGNANFSGLNRLLKFVISGLTFQTWFFPHENYINPYNNQKSYHLHFLLLQYSFSCCEKLGQMNLLQFALGKGAKLMIKCSAVAVFRLFTITSALKEMWLVKWTISGNKDQNWAACLNTAN